MGVFKGNVEFIDNSIIATDVDPSSEEEIKHKGGAIHNKVRSIHDLPRMITYTSSEQQAVETAHLPTTTYRHISVPTN